MSKKMTNSEAIANLNHIYGILSPDIQRSLDVAFKALEEKPTVEVPENAVNCVLTMFGKCSYNKTGCSDCEIKVKIRKALEDVERLEEENHRNFVNSQHIISMLVEEIKKLRGEEE